MDNFLGVLLIAAVLFPAMAGAEEGAALFAKNCALCHQAGAKGLPGQFPRLAGRIDKISGKPAGRAYLIDVLTYGMAGQLVVDQQEILGLMPPFPLDDESVALLLTYLQSLGDTHPAAFSAEEVTKQRALPRKSSAEVLAERQMLVKAKLVE